MAVIPREIKRLEGKGLQITWANGSISHLSNEKLRRECPCATCKELRGDTSHDKPLGGKKSSLRIIESSKDEELNLKRLWSVGNYAVGVEWGDGHTTGIYTFSLLQELALGVASGQTTHGS